MKVSSGWQETALWLFDKFQLRPRIGGEKQIDRCSSMSFSTFYVALLLSRKFRADSIALRDEGQDTWFCLDSKMSVQGAVAYNA